MPFLYIKVKANFLRLAFLKSYLGFLREGAGLLMQVVVLYLRHTGI